jgi:hypothetical protein
VQAGAALTPAHAPPQYASSSPELSSSTLPRRVAAARAARRPERRRVLGGAGRQRAHGRRRAGRPQRAQQPGAPRRRRVRRAAGPLADQYLGRRVYSRGSTRAHCGARAKEEQAGGQRGGRGQDEGHVQRVRCGPGQRVLARLEVGCAAGGQHMLHPVCAARAALLTGAALQALRSAQL